MHYELVYYAADAPAGVPRTEALIPSRRWEAWREATEDFEYLHRLREATQDARKAGMDEAPVAQADRTLQRVVEEVVRKTTAPGRYDRARKDLTQEILNLAGRGSSR